MKRKGVDAVFGRFDLPCRVGNVTLGGISPFKRLCRIYRGEGLSQSGISAADPLTVIFSASADIADFAFSALAYISTMAGPAGSATPSGHSSENLPATETSVSALGQAASMR